jgi:hypothetical protein
MECAQLSWQPSHDRTRALKGWLWNECNQATKRRGRISIMSEPFDDRSSCDPAPGCVDLALETADIVQGGCQQELDGVEEAAPFAWLAIGSHSSANTCPAEPRRGVVCPERASAAVRELLLTDPGLSTMVVANIDPKRVMALLEFTRNRDEQRQVLEIVEKVFH